MEGLLNYSSDDEQDEPIYKAVAERGSPLMNRPTRVFGNGNSTTAGPYARTNASGTGCGISGNTRTSYREEESTKYRTIPSGSGNRSTSSAYYNRDISRDYRDTRDSRDNRDCKELKDARNGSKYDHRMNERNRSKDYKGDYKRESDNRDTKRISKEEEDRYKTRHSSSSMHHKERYNSREFSHRGHRSTERNRHRNDDRARYHGRNSRSRSHSPCSHSKERTTVPLEQARLSALEMERKIKVDDDQSNTMRTVVRHIPSSNIAPLLALPLNDSAPKQPSIIAVASAPTADSTNNGAPPSLIQLPSYYNPSVINPNKYAEQMQKRKLLWGAKKAEDTSSKWGHAQFSEDSDGKVASKFMRLMGIKGGNSGASEAAAVVEKKAAVTPDVKSREAMFSSMEQQYEVARQVTHTMRGVGLGFSSQPRPF